MGVPKVAEKVENTAVLMVDWRAELKATRKESVKALWSVVSTVA